MTDETATKAEHSLLYQVYPRDIFGCFGLLKLGPKSDRLLVSVTWTSIVGLYGFFLAFYYETLVNNIGSTYTIVIIAGLSFIWLVDVFCYWRACFTDPGIIPARDMQDRIEQCNEGTLAQWNEILNEERAADDIYHRTFQHRPYNLDKTCRTCHIQRPILSSHCSQCDVCVSVWDHHCNWVGNCVGVRNHREFVGFCICSTLLAFSLCVLVMLMLAVFEPMSFGHVVVSLFLVIFLLCATVFVGSMASLHVDLVMQGQTLKMTEKQGKLVSTLSLYQKWSNFFAFFCYYSKRESFIQGRTTVAAAYKEEDKEAAT